MGRVFSLYVFCTSGNLCNINLHSFVSHKDGVVRHAFLYELCKGRYLFVRSVFFLKYPYLMVGIKISRVISVSIFFRLLPHFFVDPGGLFIAFILVIGQSWGQRRIRGSDLFFLHFLIRIVLFSVFPGIRGCTTGSPWAPEP